MIRDSFIIKDTENSKTIREVMNHSPSLSTKLDRIIGEAHTAVKGYVVGYRDGSGSTLDRCREVGQAISAVMYYRNRGPKSPPAALEAEERNLARIEKKWRDKGHRLPYDEIPPDPSTAVEQMAKAVDQIILRQVGDHLHDEEAT